MRSAVYSNSRALETVRNISSGSNAQKEGFDTVAALIEPLPARALVSLLNVEESDVHTVVGSGFIVTWGLVGME